MPDWEEFHQEAEIARVYDFVLLKRLLGYLAPYRVRAAVAVTLILLGSALQLVGPLLTAVTLDLWIRPLAGVSGSETGATSRVTEAVTGRLAAAGLAPSPEVAVAAAAAVYVAVLAAILLVLYAQTHVMQTMGQLIMFDLRRSVFDRFQRLDVAYFDHHPIGRLVTRATSDVVALNELFSAGLVSIFGDIFVLVGIVTVLFVLDVRLALLSLVILPLLFLLTRWFKGGARRSFRDVRRHLARMNAFLQEHVTGMPLVQLFGREAAAFEQFEAANAAHRDAHVRGIFYYAVYFPVVELINALGLALVIAYGGGAVLRGEVPIGTLVAFLQYTQRFYRPLADLSEKYNVVQAAMASAERIFELLDTSPEIISPASAARGPASAPAASGAIEFDHVDFAYRGDELVLRDVTFRIEPGETVAVVGHTGAGKSTLANLLLRFYDTRGGSVRFDGVDVRDQDLTALRSSIAMVLQDVFLFSGTIDSNIRLGGGVSTERMRWAAEEVRAKGFIERLPKGFATTVGERGAGLSVGEKQLISFARALAFDPRVLILDEATASIDTETEQRIQEALKRLLVGRTSLVIAHRLSTVRRADRILVMHKGQLREEGTHEELVAAQGIYHKLYLLQFQGQDDS
jgi:ATP-binding cassette subfamily B multidrug efflux pump